ncbi:uncharacterized protein LOC132701084 isoform X2 [Cylas formicarius]|uniref:uncharacterized protein LOC132701084 isoform X2 n=1 Tax=Cylas formicarius TaxID=197179 RepID=UPI0029589013|nr:uncharacterized protein LOC132701084 isoform X2 [Cylas formicarius]
MWNEGSDAVEQADAGHGVAAVAPFRYLISEQAKSLVALQELQHEVGALLEFRDLVMETFPNLRTKMAQQTSAHSTPTTMTTGHHHHHHLSNIPVRRGGEKKPGKDSGAVQDSGFSTEASSKETASSSSSAVDDELWNLLDVIQRKGTRLKEEVEALQSTIRERQAEEEEEEEDDNFERVLFRASADDVAHLRTERDLLLDRLAEMEAEVVAGRMRTTRLQEDMERLLVAKQDLEEQLRAIASQRGEINSRIHDLHVQFVAKGAKSAEQQPQLRAPKVAGPDRAKIAAILKEHDPLVLKKHLLVATVQNQVLRQKVDGVGDLARKLEKAREENDELRFQLADRTIELEGTRARARLLEDLHKPKGSPDVVPESEQQPFVRTEITSESMKAMLPIHIQQQDHSSSTESAHDHAESDRRSKEPQKRRPSKIPLKSYTPPKQAGKRSPAAQRSRSGGDSAHHSWRSNGSLGRAASKSRNVETKKWPPPQQQQQQQKDEKDPNFAWAKEKSPFRWIPSSYSEYPDSLTAPPSGAPWRRRSEFFDSIDSGDTVSSCCRSRGEDLAECDSLETTSDMSGGRGPRDAAPPF